MKTKDLALAVVFAALYIVLVLNPVGHSIAFLGFQIRVADALYPLIGLFSWPVLLGLTVGHFVANLTSPLGLLDMVSVAMFIPAKLAILRWKLKAVPLHVLSVALWVPYVICSVGFAPWVAYWGLVLSVGVGETVAELVLGVPLYLAIERRLFRDE